MFPVEFLNRRQCIFRLPPWLSLVADPAPLPGRRWSLAVLSLKAVGSKVHSSTGRRSQPVAMVTA